MAVAITGAEVQGDGPVLDGDDLGLQPLRGLGMALRASMPFFSGLVRMMECLEDPGPLVCRAR